MSDTKVYQFGETGSGTLNSLLPLLQQRGIDPAYIAGLANNNNGDSSTTSTTTHHAKAALSECSCTPS